MRQVAQAEFSIFPTHGELPLDRIKHPQAGAIQRVGAQHVASGQQAELGQDIVDLVGASLKVARDNPIHIRRHPVDRDQVGADKANADNWRFGLPRPGLNPHLGPERLAKMELGGFLGVAVQQPDIGDPILARGQGGRAVSRLAGSPSGPGLR